MPRPSAPAAITSSSTTHALPASISTTSASPALTTTSVSALLTQFNAPERGTTHSRASSIASDSPKRPQTPQLGPVARLRESGNSNRAPQSPNSAELGQGSSVDDSFAGSYSIPKRRSSLVGPQHDAGVSPVQLGRRLRATTNSVDESLPRSRNVTFDSTADTQGSRSSAPSSPGENAEPVGGDYKEPEVFGEVSTESFGAALQSLKEIESRNNSSTAAKESTGLGSDLPMPAEALQVLEQATKHSENLSEVDRDRATAELRAHSEKQLINEQDKERRQSELDSFQEQSQRNERSVLAEQIEPSNEESQSGLSPPLESAKPFIETSEPRLRRRRNFSASQMTADAEEEADVVESVQASDSVTEETPGATEGRPGAIMEAPIVAGDVPGAIRETPGAIGHTRGAVGPEQADALDAFVPPSMQVIHAGNDDGSDGSAQVSQAPAESVESGASILADSAPVKAESDTTGALEGATVAQEPSAEDAKVTAALTGAAPSIESAEQSEEVNDVKSKAVGPEGVEKAKVAEPPTTEGAKELLPDSKMTTSTDRNASHRKPGKLTAIERQIKEDGARVSSVTGKGRPGYEVLVKKQKGPRIPISDHSQESSCEASCYDDDFG
ncbi:hypothetical protein BCV69DRAFT_278585 [Microstroma glucosiphilum]|uniref:Uncharacterized protein n=1 Tax=Pseudomicrostroma glucosiphilum TaxID=1684307 RepID=A0A316U7W2_9BASI|nr:hypothetical protein BCV69DRAFT_278585 [Pseudomicrostroma glucosiphilum]PWN19045.1 hypothetical protein BCV69DRAFT_278585 [Pseudomicrostroma glucosiphilum]